MNGKVGSELRGPPRRAKPTKISREQASAKAPKNGKPAARRTIPKAANQVIELAARMTSVLEAQQATVVFAENGEDGLAVLEKTPRIDAVLTDIMMPVMDGYEVIRRIRAQPRFRTLPVIAVTAKATAADRDKCIEAGASDYIAKPVDLDRLYSLMRVWLAT